MLNVFLAIAVDNLANAQELTAAEEADERANELSEDSETIDEQVNPQSYFIYANFNCSYLYCLNLIVVEIVFFILYI